MHIEELGWCGEQAVVCCEHRRDRPHAHPISSSVGENLRQPPRRHQPVRRCLGIQGGPDR